MEEPAARKNRGGNFYGIVCGVFMSAWVLLEYAFGFHTSSPEIGQYSGYFGLLIPVIVIFIALTEYQEFIQRPLNVIGGINTGFRIAIVSALIFTFFMFIYNKYINPEWLDLMIDWQRKQLIINGASNDTIAKFAEQNRHVNNAIGQAIMGFLSSTGIGVFVTLIEIPIVKIFYKQS